MSYSIDEVKMSDKNMRLLKKLNEQTQKVATGIDNDIEEMKDVETLAGNLQLWEFMSRIINDIFGDANYFIRPQDIDAYKTFIDNIEQFLKEIDAVISRDLPRIKNRKELTKNLRVYCMDYFNFVLEVLVENPDLSDEEFNEQMKEKKRLLVEDFLRRAGFDFKELWYPGSDSSEDDGR